MFRVGPDWTNTMKERITINIEVPAFDKKSLDWPISSNLLAIRELSVTPGGTSPNQSWLRLYRSACMMPEDRIAHFDFIKGYLKTDGAGSRIPYNDADEGKQLHIEVFNGAEHARPFSIVMVADSLPEVGTAGGIKANESQTVPGNDSGSLRPSTQEEES